MKVRDLIEALQGRDPSGEVVLTLSGDGFAYVANFDLTPPANRRVILEADPEDIGVNTRQLETEIHGLENKLEDAESARQNLAFAIKEALVAMDVWRASPVPSDVRNHITLRMDKLTSVTEAYGR